MTTVHRRKPVQPTEADVDWTTRRATELTQADLVEIVHTLKAVVCVKG